jgi:hypothetical protein
MLSQLPELSRYWSGPQLFAAQPPFVQVPAGPHTHPGTLPQSAEPPLDCMHSPRTSRSLAALVVPLPPQDAVLRLASAVAKTTRRISNDRRRGFTVAPAAARSTPQCGQATSPTRTWHPQERQMTSGLGTTPSPWQQPSPRFRGAPTKQPRLGRRPARAQARPRATATRRSRTRRGRTSAPAARHGARSARAFPPARA